MKLCLLADAGSVHTQRWAASLSERGHDVTVLSLRPADLGPVRVVHLSPPGALSKLGYLAVSNRVRAELGEIRPDLLHAHYASSYGLLGAVSGFHPYIVSAWGADVFDFPRRSPLHARVVRYNLRHADVVASTSRFMKAEVQRYTEKDVRVTPFGVDIAQFTPAPAGERGGREGVTIGLVKALEEKYGIGVLVEAFELLARRRPEVRLTIVGRGSKRASLDAAIERSSFSSRMRLVPAVPHPEVPELLRQMDVFAVPSVADSESFGVAAIEASACGLPVVASRVGGLPEVVVDGETGVLVPPGDPVALAAALEPLVESESLRRRLGASGRAFVERAYNWSDSVDVMERLYSDVLGAHRSPAAGRPAKLVIVTSRAPRGSQERFVLREAEALARLGLDPVLVPVRRAARDGAGIATTHLSTLSIGLVSPRSLAALARLAGRPARLARLLRLLTADRRPRVLAKNLVTLPLASRLAEFITASGVVHVHGAWASTPATVALLAAELSRTPWSFTAHRWDITEANLLPAKLAAARFARTVSLRGRSELSAAGGHRETCGKIVCLHLGVQVSDRLRSESDRADGRERPFTVVSVGNLVEKKGHAHLVRAAALLRDRGLHHRMRVVGEGPERPRLQALIDRLGLTDVVRLEGAYSGRDVDRLLECETDLFVQPSIVSASGEYEGIPVALMEAMAAGLPVIATRTGSIEELVMADDGLLVPPEDPAALADAIERLAGDPTVAARLGSAARARVSAAFDESISSAELARLIFAPDGLECDCPV